MNAKTFTIPAEDGLPIACTLFEADNARDIVQIVHGAKEYKDRYYEFAQYLTSFGYHVVLSDNRGHGYSVSKKYPLGYMDDWKIMVSDLAAVSHWAKERYHLPLVLFAHSYGSVLARCYLEEHDDLIEKLILSGTANYIPIANLGVPLGKFIMLFKGKKGHSALLTRIGDSDDDTWINTDQAALDSLRSNPLTNYKYYNASIVTIWSADRELHRAKKYRCRNPKLKILSVTGKDDPIPGGDKGLKDSINFLRRIGYTDIESIVYPGMKHEVVNAPGKEAVWEDIRRFLKQ